MLPRPWGRRQHSKEHRWMLTMRGISELRFQLATLHSHSAGAAVEYKRAIWRRQTCLKGDSMLNAMVMCEVADVADPVPTPEVE
jgi:hypothetical protein